MTTLVTVNSTIGGMIKWFRSRKDPATAKNCQNHGIDSKPFKGRKGAMLSTQSSTNVIVGYIYESGKTEEGETRIYATDKEGNEVGDIFLNKSGEFVILGGEGYAVEHTELKSKYDETKAVLDAILTTLVAPINEPGNGAPSAFQAAIIAAVGTKTTGDISSSKVDNVRL